MKKQLTQIITLLAIASVLSSSCSVAYRDHHRQIRYEKHSHDRDHGHDDHHDDHHYNHY
jgi:hypothetical protein